MTDTPANYIDFEEWSTLAVSNPEKFEQFRQDKITQFIEQTDKHRQVRLRGLQWSVDRMRDQHKNSAMGACVALSNLMWKTYSQLAERLENYDRTNSVQPKTQTNIISFADKLKA